MEPSPCQTAEPATIEIFVVGGGPAGLACAIAAAQLGHKVLVADGMKPPIDKACGEGLMPDAIAALSRLGIDLDGFASPIRGIRFIDTSNSTVAHAPFPFAAGSGFGIKRRTLHQLLLDRAIELGVTFCWETVVRGLVEQGSGGTIVRTNRGEFAARFVVGADGHQSRVRSFAGLDGAKTTAQRVGLRQHFAVVPWSDFVEVYWSDHGQAYVTPVSSTVVCVAFVSHSKFAGCAEQVLLHFPQLSARLAAAIPADHPRGAITYSRKLYRVTQRNIALLGDASGSVDAVTGEGLSLAFRQAISLAGAIHTGDLASYQRSHRRMLRMPHLMARAMLLLDRRPLLRSRSIALLASFPRLFSTLLDIHIGHVRLWPLGRRSAVSLQGAHGPSLSASTPVPHNAVP